MTEVKMAVASRTDVGRARNNNEDAFTITDLATGERLESGAGAGSLDVRDRGVLLALSDGMGGHQAGEVASALVLESLRTAMQGESEGSSIERKIEAAVLRAHADVANAAREENKRGMGATLTAVFVQGSEAYVTEVGDSRAYILRGERLRQITRDQSLVQVLVETGVLTADDAKVSPHKNVILQSMGHTSDVRVAIGRLQLRRGDRLMLCCDGISNAIEDSEIRLIVASNEPEAACQKLVDLANERGGEDNLTVIIAQMSGNGLERPGQSESVTSTFQVIQEFDHDPKAKAPVAPRPARARKAAAATASETPVAAEAPVADAPPVITPARTPVPAPARSRPMGGIALVLITTLVLAVLCVLIQRMRH